MEGGQNKKTQGARYLSGDVEAIKRSKVNKSRVLRTKNQRQIQSGCWGVVLL